MINLLFLDRDIILFARFSRKSINFMNALTLPLPHTSFPTQSWKQTFSHAYVLTATRLSANSLLSLVKNDNGWQKHYGNGMPRCGLPLQNCKKSPIQQANLLKNIHSAHSYCYRTKAVALVTDSDWLSLQLSLYQYQMTKRLRILKIFQQDSSTHRMWLQLSWTGISKYYWGNSIINPSVKNKIDTISTEQT